MKRDTFIAVIALAQAAVFLLGGLWPLADIQSFGSVMGAKADPHTLRCLAGVQVVIAGALIWSVHRGLVDPPMRMVVLGASAILGVAGMIAAFSEPLSVIRAIEAGIHLAFAVCWTGILLTAGSPYRPRPVAEARRMRQSTGEGPGRWK